MQMSICVAYIGKYMLNLSFFVRFIIISHSQLFLILRSFTTILDGMSLGHKVLRL